jgi:hypothetical protein
MKILDSVWRIKTRLTYDRVKLSSTTGKQCHAPAMAVGLESKALPQQLLCLIANARRQLSFEKRGLADTANERIGAPSGDT